MIIFLTKTLTGLSGWAWWMQATLQFVSKLSKCCRRVPVEANRVRLLFLFFGNNRKLVFYEVFGSLCFVCVRLSWRRRPSHSRMIQIWRRSAERPMLCCRVWASHQTHLRVGRLHTWVTHAVVSVSDSMSLDWSELPALRYQTLIALRIYLPIIYSIIYYVGHNLS